MILFVQNLCSATREVLKCTTRYSSSFEEDGLLGLIRLGFRSPLDMLPGGLLSGGASPRAAYQSAALSAAHATQQPNVKSADDAEISRRRPVTRRAGCHR